MFPVPETGFCATDRVHEARSDCSRAPVIAQGAYSKSPWRVLWIVPLFALALCLALQGAAWASEPMEGPPLGVQSEPRSTQSVTWFDFTPTAWVKGSFVGCSVTVSSTVDLEPDADAYSVSTDGGANWSGWLTDGLSIIVLGDNTHRITVIGLAFQDSATQNKIRFRVYEGGVTFDSPIYEVKVDSTPPGPPTMLTGSPARQWTRTNRFSESWQNPEDLSGITGVYYKLNSPPTSVTDGTYVDLQSDVDTISNIQVDGDGKHGIFIWLVDAAGNADSAAWAGDTDVFWYDSILPASTVTLTPTLPSSDWYTTSVSIGFSATDLPTDLTLPPLIYARLNGGNWAVTTELNLTAEGAQELEYQARDKAGNVEPAHRLSFGIDMTAPPAPEAIQVDPPGWTDTNAFDVTWIPPADNLSGVAGIYYKLESAPNGPYDGVFISETAKIENFTVPAEGVHRLYLWLRDAAGNADHTTAPAEGPLLRYDGTAPATTIDLDGSLGLKGWYRSPVNATLAATDGLSGVSALHHCEDGGEWKLTPTDSASFFYTEAGIYQLEFYAEDLAGNEEAVKTRAVKVDYTAPVPLQVSVLPERGSATNSFRLEWPPIEDLSGVTGAYVKFGSPPSGPTDGVFYEGATAVDGVVAPGEGQHTAYVWLEDAAGNADHAMAVVLPDAVCYDVTPPVTVVTPTVPSGLDGWYIGPVTFAMSATDAGCGVREILHQVDGGPWTSADPFVFGEDGQYTIRISAIDHAGNTEPARFTDVDNPNVFNVAIDRTPPQAAFTAAASIESEPGFEIAWSGWDRATGSGLASFDVDVRDGYDAPWEPWLQETSLTTAHFDGERGHTYFFRVFARDRAGNRQGEGGITRVLVQPVLNGGFDNRVPEPWTTYDGLFMAVGYVAGPDGEFNQAMNLGSEDYEPCYPEDTDHRLPQDRATISQIITIPPPSQVQWPVLMFWYRVKTYDVMYSQARQRLGDTFDVKLCAVGTPCTGPYDGAELELLLRDGNPMNSVEWWNLYKPSPPLYDTGWKAALIDLSLQAGQTLQLVFANENRIDNMFNTWSYVDDIRIVDLFQRTLVPFVSVPGVRAAAAAVEPSRGAEILTPASEESIR